MDISNWKNKTEYLLSIIIMFTEYGTILGWFVRGSSQEGIIITWKHHVKASKTLFLIFYKFMHQL